MKLPLNHVHVCNTDIAVSATPETDQRKVLQQLTANSAGADNKPFLLANLLLEVLAEHGNLTVIPAK